MVTSRSKWVGEADYMQLVRTLYGNTREKNVRRMSRSFLTFLYDFIWNLYEPKRTIYGNTRERYMPPISRTLSNIVELLWNLFDLCMDTQQLKHLITILWYCWIDRSWPLHADIRRRYMPSIRRAEESSQIIRILRRNK